MSIALLMECANEVRRLAIAGSPLAVGDFRLKRLIKPLEQVGQKAPIFNKVAKAADHVVNGGEKESAEKLLALTTLLNAILYTQGQTSVQDKFEELKSVDMGFFTTNTPLRKLKPLRQALTKTGSGRLEIIKNAHEDGLFKDIRLTQPAIQAIDDSYREIGDYITRQVLPMYGKAIIPILCQELDLKGGRSHARRLELIYRITGQDAWDLITQAIENGSKEIKLSAIKCCESPGKNTDEALSILFELSKARNKEIRRVALQSLGKQSQNDKVADTLLKVLKSKDFELAIIPIQKIDNPGLIESLIKLMEDRFAKLFQKSKDDNLINDFIEMLSCFEKRKEPQTEAFLISCFSKIDQIRKIKPRGNSYYSGKDIYEKLAELLLHLETPDAYDTLIKEHEKMNANLLPYAFTAAILSKEPAFIYHNFSPYLSGLSKGQKTKAKNIIAVLEEYIDHPSISRDRRWMLLNLTINEVI